MNRVEAEHARRLGLWQGLKASHGTKKIRPSTLRAMGIYGGAQGIWVDKSRTSQLSDDQAGITVALLHTGIHYADDLAEDCILYHYPSTQRPRSRDEGEIAATKNARRFGLPDFVITHPSPSSQLRDVALGWVEEWDDGSSLFLVSFGEDAPAMPATPQEEQPFQLTAPRAKKKGEAMVREGQQRFRFRCLRRYGSRCAFCGIQAVEVLDAAHVRPKEHDGSDDPRSGLVLCATHHRAFESMLAAIEPLTGMIVTAPKGPDREELRIAREDLKHLKARPHERALEWSWARWLERWGG